MNAKVKALSEQARQLAPEERIQLVEDLLSSLNPVDPEIDKALAEEARDRFEAYLRGDMSATPFEDVLKKYRKL